MNPTVNQSLIDKAMARDESAARAEYGAEFRSDLEQFIKIETVQDCVGSYWCYGYRAQWFQTFFFNVINMDDGRSVSTPWIVDDAFLYAASAPANKIRMAGGQKPAPAAR